MLYVQAKQIEGNRTKYIVADSGSDLTYKFDIRRPLNMDVLGVKFIGSNARGIAFKIDTVQELIRQHLCKFQLDKKRQSAISANGDRYLTYRQNSSDIVAYKVLTETFVGEYGNSTYNGEPLYKVDCFNPFNIELIAKIISNQQ